MSTQTAEKIYKEVKAIRQETKTLKELFFLVLNDPEGGYRDSFIKKILRKSHSKPEFLFGGKSEFLRKISS